MSKSLSTLFDASKEINDGTKSKVQQVRETLNIPKTATQPYTQNTTQFPTPTSYLSGYNISAKNNKTNITPKIFKKLEKLDWNRLDDLIIACLYVLFDKQDNVKEKINKMKEQINDEIRKLSGSNNFYDKNDLILILYVVKCLQQKSIIFIKAIVYGWLWKETNRRLDKFYSRSDIQITDNELDIKNDMRHIVGLAFFTKLFGAEKTRKLGYLKEHLDFFTHPDSKDTLIDFENNERGINIALKYPNLSMDETIEKIYDIYIKNKRKNF